MEEGGAGRKEDAAVQSGSFQCASARMGMGQGLGGFGVRSPDVYGRLLRGTDASHHQDYGRQLYFGEDLNRLRLRPRTNGSRTTEGTSSTDDDDDGH